MNTKDPPDKYRTVKCALKDIMNENIDGSRLFDAMMRSHKLYIHVGQFLRLWVLDKYHNNKRIIPHITRDIISTAFVALRKETDAGREFEESNNTLLNE